MTITLPDSMKDEIEDHARTDGFTSVDAYLIFLYLERATTECDDDDSDFEFVPPPGASYAVTSREVLDAKLAEGAADDSDVPATSDFWTQRRRALAERLAGDARGVV